MNEYGVYQGVGSPYTGPTGDPFGAMSGYSATPAAAARGGLRLPQLPGQPNQSISGQMLEGLPQWGQDFLNAYRPAGEATGLNFDQSYGQQIRDIQAKNGKDFVPFSVQQGYSPQQANPFGAPLTHNSYWDPQGAYHQEGTYDALTGKALTGGGTYALPNFQGGSINTKYDVPYDMSIQGAGQYGNAQQAMNRDLHSFYSSIAPMIPGLSYQDLVTKYNQYAQQGVR